MHHQRTAVLAHPSPDRYGSDLQALETISALVARGWRTVVALPASGVFGPLARARGAETRIVPFPTVNRALLAPRAATAFAYRSAGALGPITRGLRHLRPEAVLVNTLTEPIWPLAAALTGVPCLVHVHEAEQDAGRLARTALASQLLLADRVVVNSEAAARALTEVLPGLDSRLQRIYNGVPGPGSHTRESRDLTRGGARSAHGDPGAARIALLGRLSPRKGTDVALEAVAALRSSGRRVHLDLYGEVFEGYEWFEEQLRRRAAQPDLAGAVSFHGYVRPIWSALSASALVIVPSRTEPFGNVAVEAMLAGRPVIASRVQGLAEIVRDGVTGLQVTPGDPGDLAHAIARALEDPAFAARLADAGRRDAKERFSVTRYRTEIANALEAISRE
ncbi:hypothetical protein ATL40_2072 [Serinibacter salmoneus]|uniref:Glycosyltransferase subfamily 4-like N-terminal domain-containing protein n=2 Tax=Serinibacter salmoneus TaxID=556530 RepID=A0A2A9D3E2_9MICO|nr:hypothetical protein ATL40_2072 [Serinibacter salmoneus]